VLLILISYEAYLLLQLEEIKILDLISLTFFYPPTMQNLGTTSMSRKREMWAGICFWMWSHQLRKAVKSPIA